RAGYIENWKQNNTYSGTPQGGIISPILSNIYLNELDEYMRNYKEYFDLRSKRANNREYVNLNSLHVYYKNKLKKHRQEFTEEQIKELTIKVRELRDAFRNIPSLAPMDDTFKRVQYVRYADDFIIGVIGSKQEAEEIKEDLTNFLKKELKLELSQEKTLITHSKQFARFLGYDIATVRTPRIVKMKDGRKARKHGEITLQVPKERWVNKLTELNVIDTKTMNGKQEWKAKHRGELLNSDDLEIISLYNAELRGIYNYYRLASNVSVLNKFHWIMERSLMKTYASKHKTSGRKFFEQNSYNGKFGIKYKTKKGEKIMFLHPKSYVKNDNINKDHEKFDNFPNSTQFRLARNSLIERLQAEKCEWCGKENVPLEIHHVRKLKDLKGKRLWEKRMIERNRKTLALCARGHGNNCHMKLHAGNLD
ncbi:HNH endonuclease, partial [Bacillus cereus]